MFQFSFFSSFHLRLFLCVLIVRFFFWMYLLSFNASLFPTRTHGFVENKKKRKQQKRNKTTQITNKEMQKSAAAEKHHVTRVKQTSECQERWFSTVRPLHHKLIRCAHTFHIVSAATSSKIAFPTKLFAFTHFTQRRKILLSFSHSRSCVQWVFILTFLRKLQLTKRYENCFGFWWF